MRYLVRVAAVALLVSASLAFFLADRLLLAKIIFALDDVATARGYIPPLDHRVASMLEHTDLRPWEIPKAYTIYLRQGHSMEDHRAATGWALDLNRYVDKIYTDVPPDNTTFYSAVGVGDAALRVIRTDRRGVLFAEPTLRPRSEGELAPLTNAGGENRIAGSFAVFLGFGYSMEKHKAALGDALDLDEHIRYVFDSSKPGHLIYSVENVDDTALDAIRSDLGVQFVECDQQAYLIE